MSTIVLIASASPATSPARLDGDLAGQVPALDRLGDLRDRADLAREIGRHDVDIVGQVLPGACHAADLGLAAELALGADLAGDPRHLVGEGGQLVDHGVDGGLDLEDLAARVDCDLLAQVSRRDRRGDLGDGADLTGQVRGHDVDIVGQVLPHPGDTGDLGLAAQCSLDADLAGHPGHLVGEGGQLVDHRVHGVLQRQDLAERVHLDLLCQIAPGHGGGDLSDVAHLVGQVAGHAVDRVGQLAPHPADPGHLSLSAEPTLAAHLLGDPGHLGGDQGQLVQHAVEDLADLAQNPVPARSQPGREVAVAHGRQAREQLPQPLLVLPCGVVQDGRPPWNGRRRSLHRPLHKSAPGRSGRQACVRASLVFVPVFMFPRLIAGCSGPFQANAASPA
jgi:hypothetical protein